MTNVVLYATDTMADWEYGYLTAGLAMADEDVPGGIGLTVASAGGGAVTTAGRLGVQPGADLAGLDPNQIDLLVLPGGSTWGAPESLAAAENYTGQDLYQEARTVVDGQVVTAPGTAPLEFAKAVFELLGVFPQPVIDAWYGLYSTGERKYFDLLRSGEA